MKSDNHLPVAIMNQHLLHIEGKIDVEPEATQADIASLLGPIKAERQA